jgi:branched-chain amino acid transport system permease protein
LFESKKCFTEKTVNLKPAYRADQQIFPIEQDRWAIALIASFALVVVPMFGD